MPSSKTASKSESSWGKLPKGLKEKDVWNHREIRERALEAVHLECQKVFHNWKTEEAYKQEGWEKAYLWVGSTVSLEGLRFHAADFAGRALDALLLKNFAPATPATHKILFMGAGPIHLVSDDGLICLTREHPDLSTHDVLILRSFMQLVPLG